MRLCFYKAQAEVKALSRIDPGHEVLRDNTSIPRPLAAR